MERKSFWCLSNDIFPIYKSKGKPLHCTGTTDHIRPRADTASLRVTFTIDLSQKLTFPNTGIYLAAAVINKQS